MDPLSQAVVGALAAGMGSRKSENLRPWMAVGALSAMSADLDVLIRSSADPVLTLTFHRHFTHSLIFIPVGALICSFVLSFLFRASWKKIYLPAFLGYMTAAPLDALTSYGTHLFWPFTDERTALNVVSIVDPVYTLSILTLVIFAFIKLKKRFIHIALIFMLLWHGFGFIQHQRATSEVLAYAEKNKIKVLRLWVQPSLGNLFVWRGLIESEEKIDVLCLHVGGNTKLYHGGKYQRYQISDDKKLNKDSVLIDDIKRYRHFSNGFIATVKVGDETVLTDARYSPLPWGLDPLWALEMNYKEQDRHAAMYFYRDIKSVNFSELWAAIMGHGVFDLK